ncbi:hypothetical protein Plec18167_007344 [Paecilomyces lecythidis]|uniref:Triacylglycerol lipase n=1 Tax=Paecilomyces lecythidis TaxID=3004212 RepID=A0ABR3X428_9EURO
MISVQSIWASVALALSIQVVARPAPLVGRDVSSDLLDQFNLFEQYAAAAYCSENFNSTGTKLSCSAGNCPLVEAADTETLDEFQDTSGYGDTTGFLAVDKTNELIVLSFRGSSSFDNWIANIDFVKTDVDLCDGCEAHSGFWEAWGSVADSVTSQIDSALSTYSGYKLVFTGHSLGAALSTLGGTVLRNSGHTLDLYTFGCPRVGNEALAQYITSQSDANYRLTHTDDPVPKLPPKSFGFSQPSPEYWITSASGDPVTTSDIQVIQGIDSDAGNDGTATGLDIDAHKWYFNAISACS